MNMKSVVIMASLSILLLALVACGDAQSASKTPAAKAPYQDTDYTIPDLGMKFVYVAPGSFQMGSENGRKDEKPIHKVTISRGFWIGKYEVTQKEYEAVMGTNPSHFKGENRPVETVKWNDAVEFCQKLTERERAAGRLPSDCKYRLPTEAEWEFAARGETKSKGYKFSGSNELDSIAWYASNSNKKTHNVGTKAANELGIHDMSGNVIEWCSDWYGKYSSGSVTDPTGATWYIRRVSRGSNFYSDATKMFRSTSRGNAYPSTSYMIFGFRVVKTISKTKK